MSESQKPGVWVTYRVADYGLSSPVTFSGVRIFGVDDEITALRHANAEGLKTVFVEVGQKLEDAVFKRSSGTSLAS